MAVCTVGQVFLVDQEGGHKTANDDRLLHVIPQYRSDIQAGCRDELDLFLAVFSSD